LIAWLVASGRIGLVSLAWVSLAAVLVSGLAKCWCTYRHSPCLQIRPRLALRSKLAELVGYGFWNFLISVAALARTQLSPLLVGGLVGVPAVGPFSIVMRLPTMAAMILTAATGVFTPVAVAIHAHEDHARRQRLLIEGTRLSLCLALYFLALFIWLGKPLLTLWIRPDFAAHWPLLVIIGCGEVLPMTMSVATGMLQAMARHRAVAWFVAAETITALGAAALFSSWGGLIAFVTALACAATLFRGIFILTQICRVTSIGPLTFARMTLVAPVVCAAFACIPLHIVATVHPPSTWPLLFAYTTGFTALYGCVVAWRILGWNRTWAVWTRLRTPLTAGI
jgi:O-antigen/teichoic acid export membrane protein